VYCLASLQLTLVTGASSSPVALYLQPPAATHAFHSRTVTGYLPMANGFIVTRWGGRSTKSSLPPMIIVPAGSTTISGSATAALRAGGGGAAGGGGVPGAGPGAARAGGRGVSGWRVRAGARRARRSGPGGPRVASRG